MMRAARPRSNTLLQTLALLFLLLPLGCDDELDPTDPEDSYMLFREALFKGDGEAVWKRSDKKTHEYFDNHVKRLQQMDEQIVKYLPSTDHKIARKQSGTELLKDVKTGKQLFLKVFKPVKLGEQGEAIKLGSEVETVEMSEDKKTARLTTKGKQSFYLTKNPEDPKDEQWYVMLTKSTKVVEKNMNWLPSNDKALEQTIEDLITEEREMREKVIAELMNFKGAKKKKEAPKDGEAPPAESESKEN